MEKKNHEKIKGPGVWYSYLNTEICISTTLFNLHVFSQHLNINTKNL